MTERIIYFAYGSNMSRRRLEARIGEIEILGPAKLHGYDLRFHKKGSDGSGKCDAFRTGDKTHMLWGRCFLISAETRPILDQYEGLGQGYDHRQVQVECEGKQLTALTYVATHLEDDLLPWSWYVHHVLTGAEEAGLPTAWINRIRQIDMVPDPDKERHNKEMAIYNQAE